MSNRINDPEYGASFIMRDNKGKIQYIRPARVKDRLNYRIIKSDEFFNDLEDDEKLEHIKYSRKFYCSYLGLYYACPLISGLVGHYIETVDSSSMNEIYIILIVGYVFYIIIGIWFKGCVYDIADTSHTQRICTIKIIAFFIVIRVILNVLLAFVVCQKNKTAIIFILMILLINMAQGFFNMIVYCCKIKYLLRTYWLGFLFYQISRFFILLFFSIAIMAEVSNKEIYIYAFLLCVISAYMYMGNYFNTLMKDITYTKLAQALFNYPMEWMNLFCCWFRRPKDCIKEIDYKFCTCDSFFVKLLEYIKLLLLCLLYVFLLFWVFIISTLATYFNIGHDNNN